MEPAGDKFDLHATMQAIGQATIAVICHMIFKFAVHGLFMAALLAIIGLVLSRNKQKFGLPLLKVAGRIATACLVLSLPGCCSLVIYGRLPDAGVFNVNSIGFICLWSLICLHLSAEEINHSQSKANDT